MAAKKKPAIPGALDARELIAPRSCKDLVRLNALVTPGEVKQFPPFTKAFCLTDVVLDLWDFPNGLSSTASCAIWLVVPAAGTSEIFFQCFVDKYGHQIHLNSGIFCPKNSYLTANAGFAQSGLGDLRVLLTGHYC
jgi:hypothetical protein